MAAQIQDMIHEFALAARVLGRNESDSCARLAQIVTYLLFDKAKAFVRRHLRDPLLFTFGPDGTPLLVVKRFSDDIPGLRKVHRTGGKGTELLAQRGFLKTIRPDGSQEVRALVQEPRPLDKGKTALCAYTAAKEFFPTLWGQGHTGIAMSHCVADRALFSVSEPPFHQRHAAYCENLPPMPNGPAARLLRLTDWAVATGCSNHDCQNSIQ